MPSMKRLLLVGAGHAHLRVLQDWARAPVAGWQLLLLTPSNGQLYSGMLPGWIAGRYGLADCTIGVSRLCRDAAAELQLDTAHKLDLVRQRVHTTGGSELPYDLLSLDIGSRPDPRLEGDDPSAVPVRPLEGFAASWPQMVERIQATCRPFRLLVVGSGAAALELVFAVRHAAMVQGWSHLEVALVGTPARPLAAAPARAQHVLCELLRQRCIRWRGESRVAAIRGRNAVLASGEAIAFDACWIATGAAAWGWPAAAGLACDPDGFVRVRPTLQSASHASVFAAGDCASLQTGTPKSGVYAVRAGPALSSNLRAFCQELPLADWHPPSASLNLVSTGDRTALALWRGWAHHGATVWRWKDHIDRAFIRRYGGVGPS